MGGFSRKPHPQNAGGHIPRHRIVGCTLGRPPRGTTRTQHPSSGWDDFILRGGANRLFTVPTVPLDLKYLVPTVLDVNSLGLVSDERVKGKIKWYTKPLVFGGSPTSPDNICWITLEQHIEAVKWWNQMYRTVSQK